MLIELALIALNWMQFTEQSYSECPSMNDLDFAGCDCDTNVLQVSNWI